MQTTSVPTDTRSRYLVGAVTRVSDRFGRYAREKEHHTREPKIEESPVQKALRDAFFSSISSCEYDEQYRWYLREVSKLKFTSSDITQFCLHIESIASDSTDEWSIRNRNNDIGLYISALVNSCPDEDFLLVFTHTKMRLRSLGWKNQKNVIIEGDIAGELGSHMVGGRITINGYAGYGLGYAMSGGELVVNGDTRGVRNGVDDVSGLGTYVKGGKIIINGHVGSGSIGDHMEGGEIHINENDGAHHYHNLGKIWAGKIFSGGELEAEYKEGKRIPQEQASR